MAFSMSLDNRAACLCSWRLRVWKDSMVASGDFVAGIVERQNAGCWFPRDFFESQVCIDSLAGKFVYRTSKGVGGM